MSKTSLGFMIGVVLVATSSCGDSGGSDDDDAGESAAGKGGAGSGGGHGGTTSAASGKGGHAGSTSNGGGSARGGSGGGAAGGDAGNDDPGPAGEGGAPAGTSGKGGTGGTTPADAGANGAGVAGENAAGNGGEASTPTGCELEPAGTVLVDADFASNVFLDAAWTRSDLSVSLADGIVSITTDGDVDDYIQVELTNGTLPLVVEIRQRTVESTTRNEVVPVTELLVGGAWFKVTYLTEEGWLLSGSSSYSGSHRSAPAQGEWVTVRALIDTETSELCAKKDGASSFKRVTTTATALSSPLEKVHVRQAWDFSYEISSLRVQRP